MYFLPKLYSMRIFLTMCILLSLNQLIAQPCTVAKKTTHDFISNKGPRTNSVELTGMGAKFVLKTSLLRMENVYYIGLHVANTKKPLSITKEHELVIGLMDNTLVHCPSTGEFEVKTKQFEGADYVYIEPIYEIKKEELARIKIIGIQGFTIADSQSSNTIKIKMKVSKKAQAQVKCILETKVKG